jgi:uncharacterized protein with GYD domain
MPLYVLLSTLTSECKEKLRSEPDILVDICNKFKECKMDTLPQFATLGPYNFVNIVEVESDKAIYGISAELNALGTINTIVMPALPLKEYLSEIKKMAKKR